MWLKNSEGKQDAVLTMTWFGFIIVMVKVLIGGISVTIAEHAVSLGTVDATVIGAILTPTLGAYVARRHTDRKYIKNEKKE